MKAISSVYEENFQFDVKKGGSFEATKVVKEVAIKEGETDITFELALLLISN